MAHINPVMDFRLKLEIDLKDEKRGITIADVFGDSSQGLDMSFSIVKSYENIPQTSTLTIYNLSSDIYNLIYEKAEAFRLSCARGQNQDYVPFYTGYPINAVKAGKETVLTSNKGFMAQDANAGRSGQNDLETEITLMNYGIAQLFKSYQDNVSVELVLKDCLDILGLPKGNIDTKIMERIQGTTLTKGFTSRGNVSKVLDLLGNRYNFNWNTNDMQLNIYDKNRNDIKTYGIVLTPHNSSTPERQDDKFKSKVTTIQRANKKKGIKGVKSVEVERLSQGFKIKTQLLPFLQCGATCHLGKDDDTFGISGAEGDKYIYRIHHIGNNYGTDCYTEIFCC
jgi:hypothetical protein